MAVRVCRGYRTLSHEVACALAGSLPWELEAEVLASVYRRRARAREAGPGLPLPREVEQWRRAARDAALESWARRLALDSRRRGAGAARFLEAVRPILKEWVERGRGGLSFRLTQVLSGHGCFGRYLCNVARREETPVCHQCGCPEETAQHVLEACPGAAEPRLALAAALGGDLSLAAILARMVADERSWSAMASFCEQVMSQREAEERARERDPLSHPLRRERRRGRAIMARSPSPLGGPGAADVGTSAAPSR